MTLAAFRLLLKGGLAAAALGWVACGTAVAEPQHALAIYGDPKYPAGFEHFDYVDPDAPRGGAVRVHAVGTFDSLNPFILRGNPASGLGFTVETLMLSSDDEPFTEYGLIAESIEIPDDRSWVIFKLHDRARFSDGSPVTVEDVIFSFDALVTQGHPFYAAYYASVAGVEDLGDNRVKFAFAEGHNRELPLIMGQLPVLSKRYYETRAFDHTTLEPMLGSGPYVVEDFEVGRWIAYRRNPDYWGWNLAINRGRWNFDRIRYEYFRDETVALEAFKAGEYDFRQENMAKAWATSYAGPPFESGAIVKEEIEHAMPSGMQGFAFNIRRAKFADRRVREALGLAFDFEWANQALFYNAYTRSESYFANSDLASRGLPSDAERALLEPFRGQIPDQVFDAEYRAPTTDGSGNNRANLRAAKKLLGEAGWIIRDQRLVHAESGEPMAIEFLLVSQAFERVVLPFIQNLKKLGIEASVRTVDAPQYQERLNSFDFDIVVANFPQSLSPGNEQRDFWSSEAAGVKGSRNLIGIRDPVVDALIEKIIAAPDEPSLIAASRALDRVLLWNHYMIPQWHIRSFRIAYWNRFARPAVQPPYALGFFDRWWIDPTKSLPASAAPAPGH